MSHECPGKGVAKDCEAAGGSRQLLSNHMQEFWKQIGYVCESSLEVENDAENIEQQVGGQFTPRKEVNLNSSKSVHRYSGVIVKWFPKNADHGDIMDFLVKFGVPADHESINIKENGQVVIENLDSKICEQLCSSVNGNKFKNKKNIYCQAVVAVTPEKSKVSGAEAKQNEGEMSSSSGKKTVSSNDHSSKNATDTLDDYEFCEVNKSKFYTRQSEDESDVSHDYESEIERWSKKYKKRKNSLSPTENSKKLNQKASPKTRKKH